MKKDVINVWISKYALSTGIEEVPVTISENFPEMCTDARRGHYMNYHKGDWHFTKQEAIDKAVIMLDKKIISLKKQIEKLSKTKFE